MAVDLPHFAVPGKPGVVRRSVPLTGSHGDIDFSTKHTNDRMGVATTLTGATFSLNDAGDKIRITDRSGTVIDRIPLNFAIDKRRFGMTPTFEDGGATLRIKITEVDSRPPRLLHTWGWELYDTVAEPGYGGGIHRGLAINMANVHATDFIAGAIIGGVIGFALVAVAGPIAIVGAPIAVIAAVHGACVGGTIGLMMGYVVRDLID